VGEQQELPSRSREGAPERQAGSVCCEESSSRQTVAEEQRRACVGAEERRSAREGGSEGALDSAAQHADWRVLASRRGEAALHKRNFVVLQAVTTSAQRRNCDIVSRVQKVVVSNRRWVQLVRRINLGAQASEEEWQVALPLEG